MEPVTDEAVADDQAAENPNPDNPNPDSLDSDGRNTDSPDSDGPDPDNPDPDNPDSDSPDSDGPNPDNPNRDNPDSDSPDSDSPVADSPKSDITKSDSPDADSPATDESGEPDESPGIAEALAASRRIRVPVLLGGAAVVLAAFAVVAGIQAHNLRGQQSSRNTALTDAAATSQVQRQVDSAINTVFSYNYADTGTTRAAAQRLLTGAAVREYDSLFKLVETDAPAQHLVLTTKVSSSGVELLEGDRARVLIFADQRDTRMTTHQTSYAGAMFAVNAVRQGGRWKIENIDTFTGS
jgi:Mce-associated membrane protein